MNTNKEVKELLLKGKFHSYANCVYLGGACNVGKTTLACILIGAKIPSNWNSTDGLTIYFGKNGIDLNSREMAPLLQGSISTHVLNILINGKKSLKIFYCYKK
jgi:hypothetical protein